APPGYPAGVLEASMGPRSSTAESSNLNAPYSEVFSLQWGRGHRPRKAKMNVQISHNTLFASMGPRSSTAESKRPAVDLLIGVRASMGPRSSTAESLRASILHDVASRSFNGAAVIDRGKPADGDPLAVRDALASMGPRSSTAESRHDSMKV